jgi:hypothetical protein
MSIRFTAAALFLLALIWSAPAAAGVVTITYEITSSSTENDLGADPGQLTVTYQAADINTLLTGQALLSTLNFNGSTVTTGGATTGGVFQILSPVVATFAGYSSFITSIGTASISAGFGTFASGAPVIIGSTLYNQAPQLQWQVLGGGASISGAFLEVAYSGTTIQIASFVGQETSRTFTPSVPEPSAGLLLAAGLAGGLLLVRRRGAR